MHPEGGRISIWFFIGVLVLTYGVLIFGASIYDQIMKTPEIVGLANLHAGIWWGLLMVILGGVYTFRYYPREEKS
jgi:CBS domain containing-hemolysin-like protein